MAQKITLMVCRSCIDQNAQSDPALQDQAALHKTYEKKLKTGFFRSKIAELRFVDCLTNCENPNAVQIDREDGEILLGLIRTESEVDEVIRLVKGLNESGTPLLISEKLQSNLTFIRPHRHWRTGEDTFHADRLKQTSSRSK
jgi:predicted metal-binding protein